MMVWGRQSLNTALRPPAASTAVYTCGTWHPRHRRGSLSHGREGRQEMGRERAMRRRAGLAVLLGVLLGGALIPAAAQTVLYEDWATERIDPARWGTSSLSGSAYEVVRLIADGQLHHLLRVYGG